MRKPFVLGDHSFPTKKDAVEYIQGILHGNHDRQLEPVNETFVRAILDRHPDRDSKIGCGVRSIRVVRNPDFPTTWCFWLVRIDGTSTDFSFKECLKPSTHKQKVRAALRNLVSSQVEEFKNHFFVTRDVKICPLSGVEMRPSTSHVDHAAPQFVELADSWSSTEGGYDAISLITGQDGQAIDLVKDLAKASRWYVYHQHNAVLRVVDGTANLSRSKA